MCGMQIIKLTITAALFIELGVGSDRVKVNKRSRNGVNLASVTITIFEKLKIKSVRRETAMIKTAFIREFLKNRAKMGSAYIGTSSGALVKSMPMYFRNVVDALCIVCASDS
ncbi:MAG: hypothetical protein QXH91_03235, partial [Candidatus Bathyarchaeia archaeon]